MSELIEVAFQQLLADLSNNQDAHFSGIGLILYNNRDQLASYHCALASNTPLANNLKLGNQNLLDYLNKISSCQHPYHDGFHFIDSQGYLTHVAQFVAPPITNQLRNLGKNGARTFCSQCSSAIEGVLLVGSVSSSRKITLFQAGKISQSA